MGDFSRGPAGLGSGSLGGLQRPSGGLDFSGGGGIAGALSSLLQGLGQQQAQAPQQPMFTGAAPMQPTVLPQSVQQPPQLGANPGAVLSTAPNIVEAFQRRAGMNLGDIASTAGFVNDFTGGLQGDALFDFFRQQAALVPNAAVGGSNPQQVLRQMARAALAQQTGQVFGQAPNPAFQAGLSRLDAIFNPQPQAAAPTSGVAQPPPQPQMPAIQPMMPMQPAAPRGGAKRPNLMDVL